MARTDRGFASLDLNKRREISSKGGQAAHRQGKAHQWTSEEAREAGRKGGMASHRRRPQTGTSDKGLAEPQAEPPFRMAYAGEAILNVAPQRDNQAEERLGGGVFKSSGRVDPDRG